MITRPYSQFGTNQKRGWCSTACQCGYLVSIPDIHIDVPIYENIIKIEKYTFHVTHEDRVKITLVVMGTKYFIIRDKWFI